jgi:hypothetical protein
MPEQTTTAFPSTIQIRRGLDSSRTSITPEVAELIYATDNKKLYVGDGTTEGGVLIADSNLNDTIIVDNFGDVGVGTTTPDARFHIFCGDTSVVPDSDADELMLECSGDVGMTIASGIANKGTINFADLDDADIGFIEYNHNGDYLAFGAKSTLIMTLNDGVVVGSPTGGDKGAGSINAQAVYDDNVLLTCYVFEQEIEKSIDVAKWDTTIESNFLSARHVSPIHTKVREFSERAGVSLDIDKFGEFWKMYKHLPALPSFEEWTTIGRLSSGEVIQRLWETCEVLAIHVDNLNERLKVFENN